ncbi:hypothetical protein OUZ56_005710 [Daphnia magna]|uniref:Uncharacterized protein n=1 Tax=Daphnia magna TaxID=35525 RepID=A0ABQ9YTK4_9CRUS|nr:hypothetical protein OUZ56_005710 [Daphnia magna]
MAYLSGSRNDLEIRDRLVIPQIIRNFITKFILVDPKGFCSSLTILRFSIKTIKRQLCLPVNHTKNHVYIFGSYRTSSGVRSENHSVHSRCRKNDSTHLHTVLTVTFLCGAICPIKIPSSSVSSRNFEKRSIKHLKACTGHIFASGHAHNEKDCSGVIPREICRSMARSKLGFRATI